MVMGWRGGGHGWCYVAGIEGEERLKVVVVGEMIVIGREVVEVCSGIRGDVRVAR